MKDDLRESLEGSMVDKCLKFNPFIRLSRQAAINHHSDLGIMEYVLHFFFLLLKIPIALRVLSVQFHRSCHKAHDHSDRPHIDLVLVLGSRFSPSKLRRLELTIFAYRCGSCLSLVYGFFYSDGIKVSQPELLIVTKNDSFWVNSSMHRLGIMQSFEHLGESSVHDQKLSLRPIVTTHGSFFTLILEMVTYENYCVIKVSNYLPPYLYNSKM